MIITCPQSSGLWFTYVDKFRKVSRRLDLPPFVRLTHQQQLRFALGNPPLQLLKKDYKLWMEVVVPLCVEFAGALRRHLESLVSSVPAQAFAGRRKKKRARKTATAGVRHPVTSACKRATPAGSRGKAPAADPEDEESPSDSSSESDSPPPDPGESEL